MFRCLWAVENILMVEALFGHGTNLMAQVVYWCALVKFTVTGVSLAYILHPWGYDRGHAHFPARRVTRQSAEASQIVD